MFYKNVPLVSRFKPTCEPILFGYLYISLPSLKYFPPYSLVLNCNVIKRLGVCVCGGGDYLCCDLGMGIKAKCGGVQFIKVEVVLCPVDV